MNEEILLKYITPPTDDTCKREVREYLTEDFTRMFDVLTLMQQRALDELHENITSSMTYAMSIHEDRCIETMPSNRITDDSHRIGPSKMSHETHSILDSIYENRWISENNFSNSLSKAMHKEELHDASQLLDTLINYINQDNIDL